jgi:hypothetical protein
VKTRADLKTAVEHGAAALEALDLHSIARTPPPVTDVETAYILARCIPIVMTRRAADPNYGGLAQERIDDVIWKLRDAGEDFLGEYSPKTTRDALLLMELIRSMDGDPGYALKGVLPNIEAWLWGTLDEGRLARLPIPTATTAPKGGHV